jgi:hypothetical protein
MLFFLSSKWITVKKESTLIYSGCYFIEGRLVIIYLTLSHFPLVLTKLVSWLLDIVTHQKKNTYNPLVLTKVVSWLLDIVTHQKKNTFR